MTQPTQPTLFDPPPLVGDGVIRTETDYQLALAEARLARHPALAAALRAAARRSRRSGGQYTAAAGGRTIDVHLPNPRIPGVRPTGPKG